MTAELIMILATYVEKFEILQDSTDYRDYMDLSFLVWLWKWSLLDLISYNLDGSVTMFPVEIDTLEYSRVKATSVSVRLWIFSIRV